MIYGATAFAIEALLAAATGYAASKPELLRPDMPPLTTAEPKRSGMRAALWGLSVLVGVLVLPRVSVFAYFGVAAFAVLSPRGELRLSMFK